MLIGVVVALAQLAPSAPGSPATPGTKAGCSILVTSPQQPASAPGTSFSAKQILDIRFGTVLRRSPMGAHELALKVYTPRGHLYQTLTTSFDGGETPGVLRPQRDAPPNARPNEVSATLPVGGTAIVTNSLYGRWRVEPFLDGELCGQAARFEIRP